MRPSRQTSLVRRAVRAAPLAVASLSLVVGLIIAGCGGPSDAGEPLRTTPGATAVVLGSPMPLETPASGAASSPASGEPVGPSGRLCDRIGTVQARLSELAALELRPTARVTLDIELSRVQAAFSDMRQGVLDSRGLDLDEALRRLGYRLDDLTLAVEDFRTTSRPREGANHVAEEAILLGDALAGFLLLAGC